MQPRETSEASSPEVPILSVFTGEAYCIGLQVVPAKKTTVTKPLRSWPVYKDMGRVAKIVLLAGWALFQTSSSFAADAKPVQKSTQATAWSLIAKGQEALKSGRYKDAILVGNTLTAKYPRRYEGPLLVGRANLALDEPGKAEPSLRKALGLAPAAAKATVQGLVKEASALKQAFALDAEARSLKLAGDLGAAARTEENAYHTASSRAAFGFRAAELFESADLLEDARRLLEEIEKRNPTSAARAREKMVEIQQKVDAAVKQEEEDRANRQAKARDEEARRVEAERKAAEKKRLAREAEEKRIAEEQEAARRAEEERQKAERERQIREETDRLNSELSDRKRAVSDAESALRSAEQRVNDADRDVRQADSEVDRARSRRDQAKSERDRIQAEIDAAKTELGKQVLRGQLRSAESAYDDAKGDYDRAHGRLDDAKNRLSQARSDCDSAKQTLDRARQDVRDTEDALNRLSNGG